MTFESIFIFKRCFEYNKNKKICILLFLFPLYVLAQKNQLKGYIISDTIALKDVNIINISNDEATISNEIGFYTIHSKVGDTLLFTHIAMSSLQKILTKSDFYSDDTTIYMKEKVVELEEAEIIQSSKISAVSLGIIPKEMRQFSQYERRLETAGDFKAIHLLSLLGGSLALDPIFNAINGRTKKIKRAIEVEKKQKNIAFLEVHYTDFLSSKLGLSKSEIGIFFDYLIENDIYENNIKGEGKEKTSFFLIDAWNNYKKNIVPPNISNNVKNKAGLAE